MEELDKLIEAVERGVDIAHHHAAAFPSESAYGKCKWHDSHKASSGSLDAAMAMREALVPDYLWSITPLGASRILDKSWKEVAVGLCAGNEARSLLIAILKAHRHNLANGAAQ